jgi:fumarylacetoacetate (FAA) hydrolase
VKLASERLPTPDGRLMVVSHDLSSTAPATGIAGTLQQAIDHWDDVAPALEALSRRLNAGELKGAVRFQPETMAAPLPRAWQWLDGSAFPTHGKLMQRAFNLPVIETHLPLMYQGMSHQFLGPTEDVPLPDEADDIDFEGEFGVITGSVPMSSTADAAMSRIRLVVQINDWSLHAIAPIEMKTDADACCGSCRFAIRHARSTDRQVCPSAEVCPSVAAFKRYPLAGPKSRLGAMLRKGRAPRRWTN